MAKHGKRTVKQLAQLAGVSVRTLHHYDAIGLLVPSARSRTGYRLYGEHDLLRLQQILIGRELGLSLEDIRRSLDEPAFDLEAALTRQRLELARRADHNTRMLRAIERALARLTTQEENTMNDEELFDGFNPHENEAKARWGTSAAYRESARRTQRYRPEDWSAMKAEQDALYRDLAKAQQAGLPPEHDDVVALVERHRRGIDRWFYPCSVAQQKALASLYEGDERFAAAIDAHGQGLTTFLVAAIRAR